DQPGLLHPRQGRDLPRHAHEHDGIEIGVAMHLVDDHAHQTYCVITEQLAPIPSPLAGEGGARSAPGEGVFTLSLCIENPSPASLASTRSAPSPAAREERARGEGAATAAMPARQPVPVAPL